MTEKYTLDMTVEEYIAVKKFLEIRRQLSDEDGGSVLFTARTLTECEKIAKELA